MQNQSVFIFSFDEGAVGVIHTAESLAAHFIREQYDLPNLKCILEIPVQPTQNPVATLLFCKGNTALRRKFMPKRELRNNKNEVEELVYADEQRSATHGPTEGVLETQDFSVNGENARISL